MSQVHELTAPARSDPASSSGASTLMNSEPNPNSNSAAKKEAKRPEKEAKAVATGTTSTPAEEKKSKDKAAVDGVVPFVNTTPKEQKKDFSGPMAAGYDPIAVEAAWYAWWLEQGFFKPDPNPRVTHSCDVPHAWKDYVVCSRLRSRGSLLESVCTRRRVKRVMIWVA